MLMMILSTMTRSFLTCVEVVRARYVLLVWLLHFGHLNIHAIFLACIFTLLEPKEGLEQALQDCTKKT